MKLTYSIALCGVALGLVAGHAQEIKVNLPQQGTKEAGADASATAPATAAPAAPAKPSYTESQIAEVLGWFYGKKMGLAELDFSKSELDSMVKGLMTAAAGKEAPYELEKIGPVVDEFMQKKQAAYMAKMKQKTSAENDAFFKKLADNKNVQSLPDGLRYEIEKPGTGPYPKADDTVKVHYTGKLLDGTVFDSSVERGEPATFSLREVIPGWTEGIQKINKGGKIKLYVPSALGYGDQGNQRIPPGATLIFDVELLDINPPAAAQPPAPAPAPAPAK
jgi:FKBP-type peptidyl-prolyl cis-trans isomerase